MKHLSLLICFCIMAAGCGDSDTAPPTLNDIAGVWDATTTLVWYKTELDESDFAPVCEDDPVIMTLATEPVSEPESYPQGGFYSDMTVELYQATTSTTPVEGNIYIYAH